MPQSVSLAWDERGRWGFDISQKSPYGMTARERKETLLQVYLANSWVSSCIDAIALYIISGGYVIEPQTQNPDKKKRDEIEEFLLRINENWDFCQYVYDCLTDEDIFGETFTEYTMHQGVPWEMFPIDCITMDTEFDKFGNITAFKQQLNSTTQTNWLDKERVVRWWQPHKRSKVDAFSPLERMQDAIYLDKQMVNWSTNFFRKGGKWDYYFKGLADEDEADRYLSWFRENFTGIKNAGAIPAAWGETEIAPLGNGAPLDMSFDKGLDRTQAIVLAVLHVPPAVACIAETGARLTDLSDNQRKIFEFITCNPKKRRFFEKFNYKFIYPYFGKDWRVSTAYANLRSDEEIAKIEDIRVRNGTRTIDETRQEGGKEPYSDGSGAIPIIVTTKEVTPVPRLKDLEDEQKQTAQVTLDTAKANADLAATKAKQAKEQPKQQPGAMQQAQGNAQNAPQKQEKPGDNEESLQQRRQLYEEGQRRGGLCLNK